jgi:transcriptional regulator with XRE-family HTH domain
MNLLDRTNELMKKAANSLTQEEIANGAGVGYDWLKKFAQGAIPSPGVQKVQRVYDFLSREVGKGGKHAA